MRWTRSTSLSVAPDASRGNIHKRRPAAAFGHFRPTFAFARRPHAPDSRRRGSRFPTFLSPSHASAYTLVASRRSVQIRGNIRNSSTEAASRRWCRACLGLAHDETSNPVTVRQCVDRCCSARAMLSAQSFQGGLRGAIKDAGGVIPGVEVTLTNEQTNIKRSTVTNERGEYVFANVDPGNYGVKATLQGYKTIDRGAHPHRHAAVPHARPDDGGRRDRGERHGHRPGAADRNRRTPRRAPSSTPRRCRRCRRRAARRSSSASRFRR